MPPKKKASEEEEEPRAQLVEDDKAAEGTKTASGLKQLLKSHPPYATMVKEALRTLDSRKGVTSQAVRNYIKKNYPTVDVQRLTNMVRKALTKKVDSGELVHVENPKLSGVKKYRLVPTGKGTKQPKGENVDPNVQKKDRSPKEGEKKTSEEGGKTKKSPSSEKPEPKPEKKPKKDKVAKTSETMKPKSKKEAEKSPSAKAKTVKAPKVPKAAALAKSKAAKAASNSPPAAKPRRAKNPK